MQQLRYFFIALLAVIAFILLISMLIIGRAIIASSAPFFVLLLEGVMIYLILAPLAGLTWHYIRKSKREEKLAELEAERYRFETRKLNPIGANYPVIYEEGEMIQARPGVLPQAVPHHYAPHIHYDYTSTSVQEEREEQTQQAQIAGLQAPTMDYIVSQVPYNSLQVCLGVSASTGNPFTMDLVEGTHYRIIGGSGFGKSCEAAAILEQVTQTNDPEHLLISLLDLEHKTSRLFEHLPHVAQLQVGRKTVDCVATSPDEVAQHFGYLRKELDRRKAMSEYDLEEERFLLIYVEEFLSLRREVNPDLLAQMMKDFSILALRGRKYKLYLLACAQVDYSDTSLREAMNQFNVNMSFCVKPTAARAAGFSSNELLKQNFSAKQRGQFVLETTGCTDILLAPHYDVKARLQQLEGAKRGRTSPSTLPFTSPRITSPNDSRTVAEYPLNGYENGNELACELTSEVSRLKSMGWGKQAIIEKVWNVRKGGSPRYKSAESEYELIIEQMTEESEGA